ncbi:MAG: hypothetical protein AAF772_11755 [Acidobacteriota bacterium]
MTHIVLVIPRGEALRNFVYGATLPRLTAAARVTLLSVVTDDALLEPARRHGAAVLPLAHQPPPRATAYVRGLAENAHDRWLWSAVMRNSWSVRHARAVARGPAAYARRRALDVAARLFGHRPGLAALTRLERAAQAGDAVRRFAPLLRDLEPDLVFNGSHIHGPAGGPPLRAAHRLGIRTAGFIFSWDNLTSRSRIFEPYDDELVWHQAMADQLRGLYPEIPARRVHAVGTPQFDVHLDPSTAWPRARLCAETGLEPARPYVLYTTGIDRHFPEEHRHVAAVIRHLKALDLPTRPQLLVRTYVKGTSDAMRALLADHADDPDVVSPPVAWEPRWQTPLPSDQALYSNLVRHCAAGINAASTVTLELLLFGKPVINLDFDPPGAALGWDDGFPRHIRFDHFRPVAASGATWVATSDAHMRRCLREALTQPAMRRGAARALLGAMFRGANGEDLLDGQAGARVADVLLRLARRAQRGRSTAA